MNNSPLDSLFLPIVSSKEMARLEALSIEEGASDEAYMDKAGLEIATHLIKILGQDKLVKKEIKLLVGRGNNGGDTLCAGCYLLKNTINVKAFCLFNFLESSKLNQHYRKLFESLGGDLRQIQTVEEIKIEEGDLVLAGLLGTGFHGKTEGLIKDVIASVNRQRGHIVSVDIPSGLDGSTGDIGPCIKSQSTLFLELPKAGFFLKDAFEYVGRLERICFGLSSKYMDQAIHQNLLLTENVKKLLPPIKRTRHKYQTGYVIALTGSSGMTGAAMLSTLAAMRAGAGIVRLFHTQETKQEFAGSFKELIKSPLTSDFGALLKELARAKALLIGPGIAQEPLMHEAILKVLHEDKVPAVIDADALLLFSEKIHQHKQPIILTPHKMEMMRCLKLEKIESEESFWALCQKFANERNVIVVLKGAPTRIFSPNHLPVIMARGDPGLAKAGSGDVLTGIIAAYLAQGMSAFHASLLGTYIHGIAGEMASDEKSAYSVIASDLIENIPRIYKKWTGC